MASYSSRIAAEKSFYTDRDIHALPPIFHYWSEKYVRPKLRAAGFSSDHDFFLQPLLRQCSHLNRPARFLSIGAGNCSLEIELASHLRAAGQSGFVIDCIELNESLLSTGIEQARHHGLDRHIAPLAADFNHWSPTHTYDGILAIQVLHHVVNLEGLFSALARALEPAGCFVISDKIGRNGHLRWPEALYLVHDFWRRLPPSYRLNRQLHRYEEMFQDFDCSLTGFEGIRAQDILPLLIEHFSFEKLLAYGNIIEPFIDRSFGPNFDPSQAWDRAFIDAVHAHDESEIAHGRLTPTSLFAVVRTKANASSIDPSNLIRRPNHTDQRPAVTDPYQWGSWPHSPEKELDFACRRLASLEDELRQTKLWTSSVCEEIESFRKLIAEREREFEERTTWAIQLERDVAERTAWAQRMEAELAERTAWAMKLNQQIQDLQALESARFSNRLRAWLKRK